MNSAPPRSEMLQIDLVFLFCLKLYTENFERCAFARRRQPFIRVTFYFFNYFFFVSWHADDCHKYIKRNNKKKRPHEKFKINARVRERFFIQHLYIFSKRNEFGKAKMENEKKNGAKIKSNPIWLNWCGIMERSRVRPSQRFESATKIGEQHNRLRQKWKQAIDLGWQSCILYGVICLMC